MERRGETAENRRRLGQFFTPTEVANLCAASVINRQTSRILDPTCGPGRMLWAAARRVETLGGHACVIGVEIDPVLSALARVPPGPRAHHPIEVVDGEIFAHFAALSPGPALEPRSFDAVVGNPPYVRYQEMAELAARANPQVMSAAARAFPGRSPSRRVDALVRACLLAPLVPTESGRPALRLAALGRLLADPSRLSDPLARMWAELVGSYSGLSDLSLPTWLLGWLAARPGGHIAFVANESPARREYGRLLRYFQLRFLQPLMVIEPADSSWFPTAQVPASLQVHRARPDHELMVPLSDRSDGAQMLHVRLPSDPDHRHVRRLARRIGDASDPMRADLRGFDVRPVPIAQLEQELLREHAGTHARGGAWLDRLEHRERGQLSLVGSLAPPPEVAQIVRHGAYQRLEDLGIDTHQGLRTGCNTFFYLERIDPDHVRPHRIFGDLSLASPPGLFRPVVRGQRDVHGFRVRAPSLDWVAFACGLEARPEDLAALDDQPADWRAAWAAAGQRALTSDLVRWIDRAAKTELRIRGRVSAIPQLSAVAPNARRPRPTGGSVPRPPAWWYSLPLAARHVAPVFLARVTHAGPVPCLNDVGAPALIDSNFITFTFRRGAPSPTALLAVLASSYAAACLELVATPMGGGALKIEAAHVRRLALPALDHVAWTDLDRLGRRLAKLGRSQASTPTQIDAVLASASAGRKLARLAAEHRHRRRDRSRATLGRSRTP